MILPSSRSLAAGGPVRSTGRQKAYEHLTRCGPEGSCFQFRVSGTNRTEGSKKNIFAEVTK